jgi:hypothetical protein
MNWPRGDAREAIGYLGGAFLGIALAGPSHAIAGAVVGGLVGWSIAFFSHDDRRR